MTAGATTRGSRAFVAAGVVWFVAFNAAVLAGAGRSAAAVLGLYGFVFAVIFGKAYALVPAYFDRELVTPSAPLVHLPLAVVPIVGLYLLWGSLLPALNAVGVRPEPIAVGLGSLGAEPATLSPLPSGPAATHVLAAGAATLLLFGIGFRLLPRFLVETPRPSLVAVALGAGAVAPAPLAVDFRGGIVFAVGASLLAIAIVGYALVVLELVVTSDRRRVGFTGVAAGAVFGILTVLLGWGIGVHGLEPALASAHYRLALGGFLGLTIVGVSFQFYPPAIGEAPGVGDRCAMAVIATLAAGFAIEAIGVGLNATGDVLDPTAIRTPGSGLVLVGSLGYAWILLTIFEQRR